MNSRQRHVVVIALGATAIVLAAAVNAVWNDVTFTGGWFAYEPGTAMFVSEPDSRIARQALVWLGAIAAWTFLAFRLYRDPSDGDDTNEQVDGGIPPDPSSRPS